MKKCCSCHGLLKKHLSSLLLKILSLSRSRSQIALHDYEQNHGKVVLSNHGTNFDSMAGKKEQLLMENITSSSASTPQPSHYDELFMQHRTVFSESLNELKNLRKQLHSAAEYFELSYRKDDEKQIVVETLKDYTIKAFINTVDHLGSMADKVNRFVDEQFVQVSGTDLKFRCIEQRLRTCQDFIDRSGLFQQSLALSFPKHHKRYIVPVGETVTPVDQSNLVYHSVDEDWFQFNNGTSREISPTIVSEESSSSTQSPKSSPKTFQFTRIASKAERDRQGLSPSHLPVMLRSGSFVKRSTTINSCTSKQRYPTEPWRSVSMSLHSERDRTKSLEQQNSGLNKRLLKALISMRKHRKDATIHKYFHHEN